ncbi:hypothetical protein V1478_003594 [Vespula squamosa]|uniref:Uncharacterized protein n=1 Tax=Vespula squamosa TaxID=30214 RepID=A0ABD2BMB7_VESSQ
MHPLKTSWSLYISRRLVALRVEYLIYVLIYRDVFDVTYPLLSGNCVSDLKRRSKDMFHVLGEIRYDGDICECQVSVTKKKNFVKPLMIGFEMESVTFLKHNLNMVPRDIQNKSSLYPYSVAGQQLQGRSVNALSFKRFYSLKC